MSHRFPRAPFSSAVAHLILVRHFLAFPVNGDKDNLESEPSEQSPEERILCTACLTPNSSHTDYCSKCGALLNSLTAFNPFDQTLIEGFAYRRAVDGPPSKIILVGIWLLFGPSILLVPLLFSDAQPGNISGGFLSYLAEKAYFAGYLVISIIILYRATTNYISKRKSHEPGNV